MSDDHAGPIMIPDDLRLEIRCPVPVTSVAELAVTCGKTQLTVASASPDAAVGSIAHREWAVFVGSRDRRRRLTERGIGDYDEAVSQATIMVVEREKARLWREALTAKIGEEPDDDY